MLVVAEIAGKEKVAVGSKSCDTATTQLYCALAGHEMDNEQGD